MTERIEHTPGPWEVSADGCIRASGKKFGYVPYASPWQEDVWDGDPQAIANGRLMAAAPDLLASLQEIIAACDACGKDDDMSLVDTFTQEMEDRARAAIASATGEKSATATDCPILK